MDYESIDNKPSINNVELKPDMDLSDIGIEELSSDMISELILEIFGVIS